MFLLDEDLFYSRSTFPVSKYAVMDFRIPFYTLCLYGFRFQGENKNSNSTLLKIISLAIRGFE